MSYQPKGVVFFDNISKREMMLVAEGESFARWLCYRHPDGQWVSLRKATDEDKKKIEAIQKSKCPTCENGIVYDGEFDKWFNCSDCNGTGYRIVVE